MPELEQIAEMEIMENISEIGIKIRDEKENSSIAYLYQETGNAYIEQPYEGIWRLENKVLDRNFEK